MRGKKGGGGGGGGGGREVKVCCKSYKWEDAMRAMINGIIKNFYRSIHVIRTKERKSLWEME